MHRSGTVETESLGKMANPVSPERMTVKLVHVCMYMLSVTGTLSKDVIVDKTC